MINFTMYVNKWLTLVASCFVEVCGGLGYSFAIYAPALKEAFDFDQTQIQTVGSALNFGGFFAVLSGLAYDSLKARPRLGPRVVLLVGALESLLGYCGLWLCVRAAQAGAPASPAFWQVLLCALVAGNAGSWYDTGALVTNVRNFPSDRGTVVGLLKAFVGLSASVFTSLYVGVFAPDALSYLLFLALGPAALIAACSFFINHVPLPPPPSPPRDARYRAGGTKRRECLQDRSRFSIVYAIVAVLSVYQMACSVYEGSHALDDAARRLATAATLSLLSLLLLVPVASGGFFSAVPSEVGVAFLGGSDDEDDEVEGEEEGGDEDEERRQRGPLPLPPSTHRRHGEGCAGADEQERRADGVCRDGKIGASATSGGGGGYRPPPLLLAPGVEDGPGDGTSSSGGAPRAADRGAQQHDDSCSGSNDGLTAPLLPAASTSGPPATPPPPLLPPPRELTVSAAVARPEFWLLALQFGVGIGAGLTYLNNLGQLVSSLRGPPSAVVVLLSLFSVANAAGRLLTGYASEAALQRSPRTAWLCGVSALSCAVACLVSLASAQDLYIASLLGGFAFGGHWSLVPAIASDLFGVGSFAGLYTLLQVGPAASSYFLATRLAGWVYEAARRAHGDAVPGAACVGDDCFRPTFRALAALAAASLSGCVLLLHRTRDVYRRTRREGASGRVSS